MLDQQCLESDLPTSAYDFAFLSNRAYMVTVAHGQGHIEIYTFSADEDVSEKVLGVEGLVGWRSKRGLLTQWMFRVRAALVSWCSASNQGEPLTITLRNHTKINQHPPNIPPNI